MTNTDRYSAFEEMNTAQATIKISDLNYSKALVIERFVNQLAGSSFDAWARMGTGFTEAADELEILEYQSKPGVMFHQETIENGVLTIHTKLLPLEVRMIEIKLK